jgi:hypothetical protein
MKDSIALNWAIQKQISKTMMRTRKVVGGFRTPGDRPLTSNEWGWLEMLRLLLGDADPQVTLPAVDALRRALKDA